jgi:glycosyltransferase involved in cell wall biosynthesis
MANHRRLQGRNFQLLFYNDPDNYPPIINGVRILAEEGASVRLTCRTSGVSWGVTYPSSVQVERLASAQTGSWREYARYLLTVLRRAGRPPTAFLGHDMHGFLPARLLGWRFRRPVVYHCHDYAEPGRGLPLGSRVVSRFEHRFARTADLVIVPDAERGGVIAQHLGLRAAPTIVANSPAARPAHDGQRLRRTLAEAGYDLERIVWRQGKIGVGHAIESTVRSIPMWRSPRWGLVLMGIVDAPFVAEMQGLARSLGVERQFVVLPPVRYDEVAEFTPGGDLGHALYDTIHINHQFSTTASNKILEYMAAGIPLLVSEAPGLRALMERHGCGVVADAGQPAQIAAQVNQVLGDIPRAKALGDAGAVAFEREYSYGRQFEPVVSRLAGY